MYLLLFLVSRAISVFSAPAPGFRHHTISSVRLPSASLALRFDVLTLYVPTGTRNPLVYTFSLLPLSWFQTILS